MKRKLLLLLFLIAGYAGFIAVRVFYFEKETTGVLRIVSTPDATVAIEGANVGTTPYEAKLPPGSYHVKITARDLKSRMTVWQGAVNVYTNSVSYISRELAESDLLSAGEVFTLQDITQGSKQKGSLKVDSQPSGAIVYLDNDQKGITPLMISDVSTGEHELSLYLPGFFRRSAKINVQGAKLLSATMKLALDQSYKTLAAELEDHRKEASEEAKKAEEQTLAATSRSSSILVVRETPTGYLNVRSAPNTSGSVVVQVYPGEEYEYIEDKNGWYKIKVKEQEGWVLGDYVETK